MRAQHPGIKLSAKQLRLVVAIAIIMAFMIHLPAEIDNYNTYIDLRDYGMVAVGYITGKEYSDGCPDGGCGPSYWVNYTVELGGETFSENIQSEDVYNAYQTGNAVNVLYSPDNPARHRIVEMNIFDPAIAVFNLLTISLIGGPMVGLVVVGVVINAIIMPFKLICQRYRIYRRR